MVYLWYNYRGEWTDSAGGDESMGTIKVILVYLLRFYSLILLGRVLISWLDPGGRTPVAQVLFRLTEPILAPIRRVLPAAGPIDLSPLIAFLILSIVTQIVATL